MNAIFVIFRKEINDAMRDRRTLMMVLFSSLIAVPLLLLIVSEVMSGNRPAGISAGIDMSLYLVARLAGMTLAQATARQMDYDWNEGRAG